MLRGPGLGEPEDAHDLGLMKLADVEEQLQDPQPAGLPESPEQPCRQLDIGQRDRVAFHDRCPAQAGGGHLAPLIR